MENVERGGGGGGVRCVVNEKNKSGRSGFLGWIRGHALLFCRGEGHGVWDVEGCGMRRMKEKTTRLAIV